MNTTIKTKGMHCTSCEMLVQDALEDENGIIDVKASFKDNEVEVKFDESKISLDKIKEVIKGEGFL
ncbi:heavy-metal-associated domain-containing protein [Candidatus Woesearchaeota archaeon]|nr:heavy-metal-associated domain-containing protein [Candidatus Woesearchaeota archaeon]